MIRLPDPGAASRLLAFRPDMTHGRSSRQDFMFRIAVPTDDGRLCPHFGRAPGFTIFEVDREAGRIVNRQTFTATAHRDCGDLIGQFTERQVDVVIAGGIGAGAVECLTAAGIELVGGAEPIEADLLVQRYLAGELRRGEIGCRGHGGHGHGHGHGHGRGHHHHRDR